MSWFAAFPVEAKAVAVSEKSSSIPERSLLFVRLFACLFFLFIGLFGCLSIVAVRKCVSPVSPTRMLDRPHVETCADKRRMVVFSQNSLL